MQDIAWKDLAESKCYSDARALLIDLYYKRGNGAKTICSILGVTRREFENQMYLYRLPLREEDKLKGGDEDKEL